MVGSLRIRALLMAGQIGSNTVAGYLMMRIMAYHFGVSAEKDAFDIAYSVPFLLMTAGGFYFVQPVISAAFQKQRAAVDGDPSKLFSTLMTLSGLLAGGLCLLAWLLRDPIVAVLAPGFAPETAQLAAELFVLFLPLIVSLGAGTVISAVLIAYEVPVLAELCQLTSRLGFIVFALASGPALGLHAASLVLTLTSLIGLAVLVVLLVRRSPVRFTGLQLRPDAAGWDVVRRTLGVIAATLFSQGSMVVLRALYVGVGPGYLAAFGFAMSLISPLTVLIGQPLAATFGLRISDRTLDDIGFRQSLWRMTRIILAACVPLTAILILLSDQVIALLYGGGAFDAEARHLVDGIFVIMALSIPPHVLNWLLAAPLMARFSSNVFVYMNLVGYGVQVAASVLLAGLYGAGGISAGYLLGVVALTLSGYVIALTR